LAPDLPLSFCAGKGEGWDLIKKTDKYGAILTDPYYLLKMTFLKLKNWVFAIFNFGPFFSRVIP
jgi:hypothetical protein